MATTNTEKPVVKVDPAEHDRVAMLSLKVDGTPDQTNPEMIGDKEQALEATKEQFAQKAVSAVDQALRGTDDDAPPVDQAKLEKAHETAIKDAHQRAERVVDDLHQG